MFAARYQGAMYGFGDSGRITEIEDGRVTPTVLLKLELHLERSVSGLNQLEPDFTA